MTISLKNFEISTRFSIFEGADFSNFRKSRFWRFDQCILYSCLCSFSLWQRGIFSTKQMMVYDQITFFIKCSMLVFLFFWCAKNLGKYNKFGPKKQIYRGFLGRRNQAGGLFQYSTNLLRAIKNVLRTILNTNFDVACVKQAPDFKNERPWCSPRGTLIFTFFDFANDA